MTNPISFQIPGGTPSFQQYIPSDAVLGASTLVDSNRLLSALATGSAKESLILDGVSAGVLTIAKSGSTARAATFPDAAIVVAGSASALTSGQIPQAGTGGILADSTMGTSGITGLLTLTKSGSTARTATFPDAAIVVAGSASALTSGRIPQAGASGILADSLLGTSGITGLLTLTKTGSTARTVTFPDAAITVARSDAAQSFTGLQTFATGVTLSGSDLTLNSGSKALINDTTDATAAATGSFQTLGGGYFAKSIYTTAAETIDLGSGAHIASAAKGNVLKLQSADAGTVVIGTVCYGNTGGFSFQSVATGGTRATPTATAASTVLWSVNGYGHNGTAITGAQISYNLSTNGVWGAGDNNTYHIWAGTPVGSTSLANWMWLQSGASDAALGTLGIGAAPTTGNGLVQLASGSTKATGIAWGTDSFLYRIASNSIKTDGALTVAGTTDSTSATTGTAIVSGGVGIAKNLIAAKALGLGVTSTATAAGTTTLTSTSTTVQIFTGTTTQTVTLPAANLFGAGIAVVFTIKNRSTATVTINRAGSDTIDGLTSIALAGAANASVTLASDGVSEWVVV